MQDRAAQRKSSDTQRHGPPATAIVAVVLANVALAFGPLFVRLADVGPIAAGFWRMSLALPVLLIAATLTTGNPIRPARGLWSGLAIAGLAFAVDLGSWHYGIMRTTIANSTLFGNSAVLVYPIYGFIAARMWPSRDQGAALLLALIGGALLLGRSAELSSRHLAGDLFCLMAGVFYAVYFMFMARIRETMAPLPALALSSFTALPPLILAALLMGEQLWPGDWTPLLALALVSQLFGQVLMIYALGHLSPLAVGIALLLQPVVAVGIGWVGFGERPTALDLLGGVLVAAALVLVRRGARPAEPLARADAEARPGA